MKISKNNLRILVENYLSEVKVTGSGGYEYEKRGNNVFIIKNKGKKSNIKLKPGSSAYKAITKQHPELLSGDSTSSGDDNFVGPTLAQAAGKFTPQDHLKAIAEAEYPGDELIKNQKTLTQIGPAIKPYPTGEVVKYVQKMLGLTGGDIDGVYGPGTAKLVQKFKDEKGIDPGFNRAAKSGGIANDGRGIIGYKTAEALLKLNNNPYAFGIKNSLEKPSPEDDSIFGKVAKILDGTVETVKSQYNDVRNVFRDAVVGGVLPLHHRGFLEYLIGRTQTWTNSNMTNSEVDSIKKLVLYSLTPLGRRDSIEKNSEPASDGALLNYGVTRGYILQVGGLPSAIYRGEEGKGFTSGIFDAEPADVIGKFLGAATCAESKSPYKDLQELVKNRKPFTITIKDNYDFNDSGRAERGFKGKGLEYILDEFVKGYESFDDTGAYQTIRYLAPLRQAGGYSGYKVNIKIIIGSKDYESNSEWLDMSDDEMEKIAKSSKERIKAAQAKNKKDISEIKFNFNKFSL